MHVSLPSVHLLKGVSLRPSNGSLNRQLPSILDGLIICYMAKRHIEKRSRIIRHNVSRETFSFFFFACARCFFYFFFFSFFVPPRSTEQLYEEKLCRCNVYKFYRGFVRNFSHLPWFHIDIWKRRGREVILRVKIERNVQLCLSKTD